MENNNIKSFNALSVWRKVVNLIKKHPVILVPFIGIALFDVLVLTLLYLAPRPPLSMVIAPIIRAFWGERFLHYPSNFLLLPMLFNYSRNILGFMAGLIFTGTAVSFVHQVEKGFSIKWKHAFVRTIRRYGRLFFVWIIMLGTFYVGMRTFRELVHMDSFRLQFALEFLINLILQMIFIFSIPAIIIENKKGYTSIIRSIAITKNHVITTFMIIFIPSMIIIPLTYIHVKLPLLMNRFVPDITLCYLGLRIFLITMMDLFITVPAVVMLLEYRKVHHEKTPDE